MKPASVYRFSFRALFAYPARTTLMLLAMSIGVASVIFLTTLGEGARSYVKKEFTSLGTRLLIVLPGRSETTGGPPPLMGETPRDLTLEDALALKRSPSVERVAPISVGSAPVSWNGRSREAAVLGSTSDLFVVRQLAMMQGGFIEEKEASQARSICVLGYAVKDELFGNQNALGKWIQMGDRRFRVIGVLADKGESIGLDMGEVVIVPVASAQALFDSPALFRVLVQASGRHSIEDAKRDVLRIIAERHDGEDDVTVITQDAVLETFDNIFLALTLTVSGIAAISLTVAGILIMNVMLVSVSQRTEEIGLLKAIGSTGKQILVLFLTESALLSLTGAVLGLVVAFGGSWTFSRLFPAFPMAAPYWAIAAAVGVSLLTGLIFGILPARRASRLDPVQALSRR